MAVTTLGGRILVARDILFEEAVALVAVDPSVSVLGHGAEAATLAAIIEVVEIFTALVVGVAGVLDGSYRKPHKASNMM